MEESQSSKGRPPIEPTVVIHQMVDMKKTPVYVEGRTDDEDTRPFINASVKKRKKRIAVDRMQLSDGDQDFFDSDSSEDGGSN